MQTNTPPNHKGYFYRQNGQRLSILDPDTLEEVGFVEVPERFTFDDLDRFRAHLIKMAVEKEGGLS